MLTFIDLFAGVGGFREGMEKVGFKCLGYCEFDKFASASYRMMHTVSNEQREYLQKNFLKVPNIGVKGLQWFENHEINKPCKKKLQKELERDEYLNGEWYANDIRNVTAENIPRADVWCFGAPCQDFSIAGNRKGMAGDRSCLVREVFRILRELKEADKPKHIIYENVMGMLSSEKGFDFTGILLEMESLRYDIEYQNLNSKYHGVPQNRDRVYTIGHLRGSSTTTVFPFGRCGQEDSSKRVDCQNVLQVCNVNPSGNGINGNVYDSNGLRPTLTTNKGEGVKVAIPLDKTYDTKERQVTNCITAREDRGMSNHRQEGTLAAIPVDTASAETACKIKVIGNIGSGQKGAVYDSCGIAGTLIATDYKQPKQIAIPVLTPDRVNKQQNGRRFKEPGDPMFTLTSQDMHGVAILTTKRTEYGKEVRKAYENGELKESRHNMTALEPRTDGISNTITTVTKDNYLSIMQKSHGFNKGGEHKISPTLTSNAWEQNNFLVSEVESNIDNHDGIYVEFPNGVKAYAIWYEKYQCYVVIRKLTPRECWRLQGWSDYKFECAALVNSDSQLYKQAGNGVTVNVVYEIARRLIKNFSEV